MIKTTSISKLFLLTALFSGAQNAHSAWGKFLGDGFDDFLRQPRQEESFDDFVRRGSGKEWTMLVFLNGNNDLDPFGYYDLNEMEVVGSNSQINIVVQWASLEAKTVRRVYVQKDQDTEKVTSPVIEDMGQVDMGKAENLVEFVRWGVEKYPAKRYFVVVWNHGSGWQKRERDSLVPTDISYDEISGNAIRTEELGQAMVQAAGIIGHKVDLYGSDACLMQMGEVNAEMKSSVDVIVGSQDVEPAYGWQYEKLLTKWSQAGFASSPQTVAKILTETYVEAFQGNQMITMSAVDMSMEESFLKTLRDFSANLLKNRSSHLPSLAEAVKESKNMYVSEYFDLGDVLKNFSARLTESERTGLNIYKLQDAMKNYVIANGSSEDMKAVTGLSVWVPLRQSSLLKDQDRYSKLEFAKKTGWDKVIKALAQ